MVNTDREGWLKLARGDRDEATPAPQPKPPPAPAPAPQQPASGFTDSLGDHWTYENGTFTSNTPLHLRWGARPSASVIAVLPAGSKIKYDAWSRGKDFVYVRQPRGNGQFGYVAVRDARTGEAYGSFK